MHIESLEIRNYRVFRRAKLVAIPELSVVVGANGSGKSTLFDVFGFLKDALTQNVDAAVARRGGIKELRSRGESGPIVIKVEFREHGGPPVAYSLSFDADPAGVVVEREVLRYRPESAGHPYKFVDFSRGRGAAVTNEALLGEAGVAEERREYDLVNASTLAIKGLGQFKEFKVVAAICSLIDNVHIANPNRVEARLRPESRFADELAPLGGNVALLARNLYEHHPERFQKVLRAMSERVPGMEGVDARLMDDGRLVLRLKDGSFKDPFVDRSLTDGEFKMFSYLVLLHDPAPHKLLAVEQPENSVYPELLDQWVEEFRASAERGGQVFVSTHSPDFLNGVDLEEIFWLAREGSFTTIRRASESELLTALVAEGDLPGALWRQGLLEVAADAN